MQWQFSSDCTDTLLESYWVSFRAAPSTHAHTETQTHKRDPFINDGDTMFNVRLNPKMFQNGVKQAELLGTSLTTVLQNCNSQDSSIKIVESYRTSSTRPKPPTPSVSMMLKSVNLRLEKKAFSASCLKTEHMVGMDSHRDAQKMLFSRRNSGNI